VSTDCPGGSKEILENGKYGKLVPVGDHEAIAKAIIDTLKNPPPKELLQERGKMFSVEAAVNKYLELIWDLK
jgi:glycosyltransferase involved in cell wall biosynthesis